MRKRDEKMFNKFNKRKEVLSNPSQLAKITVNNMNIPKEYKANGELFKKFINAVNSELIESANSIFS